MRQNIGNNKIKEREKVKATEKKGIIIQVEKNMDKLMEVLFNGIVKR